MGIIKQGILVRLSLMLLVILFNTLLEDYDSSIHLPGSHVPSSSLGRLLSGFAKWDALFFLQIAHEGYKYEKNHAFFPLFPLTIRAVGNALAPFLPFWDKDEVFLIAGLVVSSASFFLSLWALDKLTRTLFKDEEFGKFVCLLYIFSPAGVFLVAIYSEALFSCFSLIGLYFLYCDGFFITEKGIWINSSVNKRFVASFFFCLSTGTRSNGSLLFIFQVAVSVNLVMNQYLCRKLGMRHLVKQFGILLFTGIIHASPIFLVLVNGYQTYCKDMGSPYCFSLFPSIYNYVQAEYWNVGFFKYWEVKQIPNFLLAFPMIWISVCAICEYVKADVLKLLTFGAICKEFKKKPQFLHPVVAPFIIYWAVNTLILVFIANTQIITRALCSLPVLYWYLNHKLQSSNWVLMFFSTYLLVGLNLFSNFYPWT